MRIAVSCSGCVRGSSPPPPAASGYQLQNTTAKPVLKKLRTPENRPVTILHCVSWMLACHSHNVTRNAKQANSSRVTAPPGGLP